ncbi:MAG TPA: protein-disulfide reductase DsbD family protein, partial [Gemmatales bacterium]|nr:protein-disulfide reductase DsbD family protein [Gemmatales bacterium]
MLIPWILGYIDSMRNRVLSPNLILLLCYFLFLAPVVLFAQEERLDLTAELVGKDLKPGESFKIKVGLLVKEGFYTYPTTQKDKNAEAFVTTVRVKGGEAAPVERRGEVKEPAGKEKFDSTLNIVITIYDKPVELEVPFVVKEKTPAGPAKFTLSVVTQVCDDGSCLPVSKSFDFEIHVQGNAESGTSGQVGTIEKSEKIPGSTEAKSSRSASSGLETPQEARDQTLLSFMLTGVGFGFITLLTPCVFPMIPITVSFFLKQNKTGTEAITNALVYTLTIVVALSLFAYLAVSFFQQLTQMGITNLILAALFMYFALSLFGAYEITLPSFLTRWTAAGEA